MTLPKTSLIAAVAENGVIGSNNDMPWHIKSELKYFMQVTKGKPVIMGRKTFESLGGQPLKDRTNIIVTRDAAWHHPGTVSAATLQQAIDDAREVAAETKVDEIIIGGGAEIYRQALPMCDRLYLTEIHLSPEGDALFPSFDRSEWIEVKRETFKAKEGETADYTVTVLERKIAA